MNFSGIWHLGTRHLRRNAVKATLLIGALTVVLALPVCLLVLVDRAEDHFRHRAESTPLVLGAAGSELELAFNALYFSKPEIAGMTSRDIDELTEDRLALAVPLHVRYSAQGVPIVGTSIDYFLKRNLTLATGRNIASLGECVLGATAARELGVSAGGAVISTPEAIFDLGGIYPLKMNVVGVLDATGEPDDRAVFVDVKTTWVIGGLAHGHQDAEKTGTDARLESADDNGPIKLNASVIEYNEITPDNVESFHFHGDPADFPITSALIFPKDRKSQTILLGRYADRDGAQVQLVEPAKVMDELFATVFQVRNLALAALLLSAVVSLIVCILVFLLSNRLRASEFASLERIGASSSFVRGLMLFEGLFVSLASLFLTICLGFLFAAILPMIFRSL